MVPLRPSGHRNTSSIPFILSSHGRPSHAYHVHGTYMQQTRCLTCFNHVPLCRGPTLPTLISLGHTSSTAAVYAWVSPLFMMSVCMKQRLCSNVHACCTQTNEEQGMQPTPYRHHYWNQEQSAMEQAIELLAWNQAITSHPSKSNTTNCQQVGSLLMVSM